MMLEQVRAVSHSLRLFGIHACAERRAQEAIENGLHPLEFLHLVLEEEQLTRKTHVAKRLATRAKFRSQATLEEWDQTYERGLAKASLRELQALTFYHNRENLLILGPTGTGKSHLAIALGKRLCGEGIGVGFFSVNLFLEECLSEKLAGRYLAFLTRVKRFHVLVLDDFGLRNYTHDEANMLMDILEERYQKGSVIVTSQVEPEGWKKLFEDPVIAEALTDRLTQPSQKYTLRGGSYRSKLTRNVKPQKP